MSKYTKLAITLAAIALTTGDTLACKCIRPYPKHSIYTGCGACSRGCYRAKASPKSFECRFCSDG